MEYSLIAIFKNIANNNYCIGRDGISCCGTCGCGDAVKELRLIADIEKELLNIDIDKLKELDLSGTYGYKNLSVYLTLILFIFKKFNFNKEKVLTSWLNNVEAKHIEFFDAILFYVVRDMINCEIKEQWIAKCIYLANLTSNESLKESLSYTQLKNKYEFTNFSLVNKIANDFKLNLYESDHGINHWHRVYLNALEIAQYYEIQSPIFELFAIFHDSQRENEYIDSEHGKRGSQLANKYYSDFASYCSKIEFTKLQFACQYHTALDIEHHYSDDILVNICWDADRLDIGRVGIKPDKEYLFTDYAKEILDKRQKYE